MQVKTLLAAVPLCAGLMLAQTPASDTGGQSGTKIDQSATGQDMNRSDRGHSMNGILVASECNSSSMNGAFSYNGQASSKKGYETNKGDESNQTSASAINKPETGSANRTESSTTGDTGAKDTAS